MVRWPATAGSPAGSGHYDRYSASGKEVNDPVLLRDQFVPGGGVPVLEPVLFCNPTRKIHGANHVEVLHPDVHLTCYTITPPPGNAQVNILNQFLSAPRVLNMIQADMLGAPTAKLRWQVQPGNAVP